MTQRTKLQAYTDVLNAFRAGIVSPEEMGIVCMYRSTGDNGREIRCGVGALFNKKQLDNITARGLLDTDIEEVAFDIGQRNIEYVTGLSLEELLELQHLHDMCASGYPGERDNSFFERFLLEKIKKHSK